MTRKGKHANFFIMSDKNEPKTIFQEIVNHFDGIPKMAKALGIRRQAIYLWNGVIPEGRAYQFESLTQGKFTGLQILARQAAERENKDVQYV